MTKPFVHSYSAGKQFEQCHFRFYQDRVLRKYPFVQGPEAKEGDEIHSAFEKYFKYELDFPKKHAEFQIIAERLKRKHGETQVESKWGLRKDFSPCGYFDNDVYYRYRNDYLRVMDNKAVLIDWKTGKAGYPDIDQLVEGAICVFQHYPDVENITAALMFIRHNVTELRTYERQYLDDYVDAMAYKYAEVDAVMKRGVYEKQQGPLCPWCPVTDCEFWSEPKKK